MSYDRNSTSVDCATPRKLGLGCDETAFVAEGGTVIMRNVEFGTQYFQVGFIRFHSGSQVPCRYSEWTWVDERLIIGLDFRHLHASQRGPSSLQGGMRSVTHYRTGRT